MSLIYFIGVQLYALLIWFSSPFNSKARLWLKGRKKIFSRLKDDFVSNEPVIWIHCASLGEFEQGRPVLERIKAEYHDYKILLTFFSPSGYEVRKNYENADYIYYLPLDTPWNARKFIEIVKPKKVIFVKYEFWYYYMSLLHRVGIPTYVVSAIFRPDQIFFRWYGKFFRNILVKLSQIFVQSEDSLKLLNHNKITNAVIAGDTRFDRVYSITQNTKPIKEIEEFKGDKKLLIVGSSWRPDEEIILKYWEGKNPDFKLIIAPHEVHEQNINRLINNIPEGISIGRYTEISDLTLSELDILIVDVIGILSSLYKYGDIGYIGGGFGKGIHNTLEAATFGMPIIFGPNYKRFKEAVDLIDRKGAFSVSCYEDLQNILDILQKDSDMLTTTSLISKRYVKEMLGSTSVIMNNIFNTNL